MKEFLKEQFQSSSCLLSSHFVPCHNKHMKLLILCLILPLIGFAKEHPTGLFSGYISKVNEVAKTIRVRLDFANSKFLTKKDTVKFWMQHNKSLNCRGLIIGKSNDYILLKLARYTLCSKRISLSPGNYLHFYSEDLANNIQMGSEVIKLLNKKKLALNSKMLDSKRELDSYMNRVNALNERYRVLRSKLEKEWRDELQNLEDDRLITLRNYKSFQHRLNEVNFKMAKYRIEDENMKEDRWSLDSRFFYKK